MLLPHYSTRQHRTEINLADFISTFSFLSFVHKDWQTKASFLWFPPMLSRFLTPWYFPCLPFLSFSLFSFLFWSFVLCFQRVISGGQKFSKSRKMLFKSPWSNWYLFGFSNAGRLTKLRYFVFDVDEFPAFTHTIKSYVLDAGGF